MEEDGVRRLYVNSVKETGLASKKGKSVNVPVCKSLKFPFGAGRGGGFLCELLGEKDVPQMFNVKSI